MPSFTHEAFVRLFRDRPELAPELLDRSLGVALPEYTEVRTDSAELTELVPAEYRADLVVLLIKGEPVLGIVVEVQLQAKVEKRFAWPVYVTALRARLRCPVCLLVVTPHVEVARWARVPIELGPGARIEPFVLGPDAIPVIEDPTAARDEPELAVLSAMAHGENADASVAARIAFAALYACLDLDTERSALYADVVRVALGDAARAALEALMQSPEKYEFQSDFARKYTAIGRAEGKLEGRAEGELEGGAKAILRVLATRRLAVTEEQRNRVLACTDLAVLETWLDRAIVATNADEVFV